MNNHPDSTPSAQAAGSELEARHDGTTTVVHVGPRHCAICGEWPARNTDRGNRCHLCEVREWANEHPVPLPSNPAMLHDLADAGHAGAAAKLAQLPKGSALFIPLRKQDFDAFARGEKTYEYRKRGPRWNAETCTIGRRVILSRGYGKYARISGTITGFHYDTTPSRIPGWLECYGPGAGDAACIRIELDQSPNAERSGSES